MDLKFFTWDKGEPGMKSNILSIKTRIMFKNASLKIVFLKGSGALCNACINKTTNDTPATKVQCISMLLLKELSKKNVSTPQNVNWCAFRYKSLVESLINLKKIGIPHGIRFSLETLETFLEKWKGRPAISIHLVEFYIYQTDSYMKLVNKYKIEGVIKDINV